MSSDFAAARLNMVESQVRPNDVTDLALQDAMRAIPREQFCAGKPHLAYADAEVEYADGRYLLRPRNVSKLLQSLAPRAGERALAICAPYAAEVLRRVGLSVDEAEGDAAIAPGAYDVIVCEGAVAEAPGSWIAGLSRGGRLGVIERPGPVGKATIYLRSEDDTGSRIAFDATPPYLPGHEPRKSFAF